MGMQIEKSFAVKAPFQTVWEFLIDPKRVAACLPGAAITDQIDETTWSGTMNVKVGPVTAAYRGKLRFDRLDREAGEAEISGSGQETRGKGGADMRMKSRIVETAPGETQVTVTSDVNVMGVLAQFGRGMIQDVSDQLFQKFSDAMRRELEAPAPAPPVPVAEADPVPAQSPAASPAPPIPPSPPIPPREEVLDVGALGAAAAGRAAGRMIQRPVFWIVIAIFAAILYWFLR